MNTPYQSRLWRNLSKQILARDGYRCQLRLPKCKGRATATNHILDWRSGGSWYSPDNLQAACSSCNTAERNSRIARAARQNYPGPSRQW